MPFAVGDVEPVFVYWNGNRLEPRELQCHSTGEKSRVLDPCLSTFLLYHSECDTKRPCKPPRDEDLRGQTFDPARQSQMGRDFSPQFMFAARVGIGRERFDLVTCRASSEPSKQDARETVRRWDPILKDGGPGQEVLV
ncbi:hypothetical protein PTKU15_84750 [Paraburkholderia terrae]|nr:hypothetical protein PTKU15_84750 [Paraburkholderia terrae]